MIYIGIDPGQKGGYAVISDEGIKAFPWDDLGFVSFCRDIMFEVESHPQPVMCCLEKVGSMPKQGVASTFKFGKSAGFIEGVLQACGIPYQLVPPLKWKKEFSLNSDKIKSIEVCKKLFPGIFMKRTSRCTTDSDGMAEALLMAEYAKRKL